MSNMFKPKINNATPAAAPVPQQIEAPNRELGGEDERREDLKKKKGRSSLRIDPQTGGVNSSGGQGINVPMK